MNDSVKQYAKWAYSQKYFINIDDNEVEVEGWRYLFSITLKIMTLNSFIFTRINEAVMMLGTEKESKHIHLLPWIHCLRMVIKKMIVHPNDYYFG